VKIGSGKQKSLAASFGLVLLCVGAGVAQEAPKADTPPAPAAESAKPVRRNISSESLKEKIVEDFSTPSLKGTVFKPTPPLVGEMDNHPGYSRELTRLQWRPGDPVDLYVVKPAGVNKPPVILYLYSYPFELDRFRDDSFCRFLTANGFAAVGFASALTGPRYRERALKEWFVSELPESLSTSAHDVQMILNYLAGREDLSIDHVGMFGDGSGATIAILAAAVDPRIKTLDLLNPWGDWPDWMAKSTLVPDNERAEFVKPEFLARVAPLDPVQWLPELKTPKIRIQIVRSVTVTPGEAKLKIEASVPMGVKLIHYEDSKAFIAAAVNGTGFDWIKEQVKPGSTQHPYRASGEARSPNSAAKAAQSKQ